jgi:outer membrane protein OmpA-like peptidoglycan-associated protein
MRLSVVVILLGAVLGARALASEAPPASPSPSDIVKEVEGLKMSGASAAPGPDAAGSCAPGLIENEDGDCGKPVKGRGADLAGNLHVSTGTRPTRSNLTSAHHIGAGGLSAVSYAPPPPNTYLGKLPVTFRLGSAEITPAGKAQAHVLALAMLSPEIIRTRFLIAGHTDASGSQERNRVLSLARADSVKAYLVEQGVDPARLDVKGYGAEGLARPEAPFDPANRRVEARPVP